MYNKWKVLWNCQYRIKMKHIIGLLSSELLMLDGHMCTYVCTMPVVDYVSLHDTSRTVIEILSMH